MSGIMCMLLAGSGGVIVPIPLTAIADTAAGTDATGSFTLGNDGALTKAGFGSIGGPSWFVPNTSGVGAGYDVRVTVDSGTNPTGSAVGAWLNLASARQWVWTRSTNGITSASITVEISRTGLATAITSVTGVAVTITREP